ncbi:hypothetical protein Efla_002233 [Eimeria flavescens]
MPPGGSARPRRHGVYRQRADRGGGGPSSNSSTTNNNNTIRQSNLSHASRSEDAPLHRRDEAHATAVDTPQQLPADVSSASTPSGVAQEVLLNAENPKGGGALLSDGREDVSRVFPVYPSPQEERHSAAGCRQPSEHRNALPVVSRSTRPEAAPAVASGVSAAAAAAPSWCSAAGRLDDAKSGFSGVHTPEATQTAAVSGQQRQQGVFPDHPSERDSSLPSCQRHNTSSSSSNSSSSSSFSSSCSITWDGVTAASLGLAELHKEREEDTDRRTGLLSVSACKAEEKTASSPHMATSSMWLLVVSVLLTWVQDPLLSLLASAAAARMQQGAPLAVVGVGAGGQIPDGVCLLLVALGLAVGALCSRTLADHAGSSMQAGSSSMHPGSIREAAPQGAIRAALRHAAVGVWLAAGMGIAVASSLYAGSSSILSFFLTFKGAPSAAAEQQQQQQAVRLAAAFLRLRCLSLPCSIMTLTAKAALLTLRDWTPQAVTAAAAAIAAPLLFSFSSGAAAAAADGEEAAAAAFVHAAAYTVLTLQVLAFFLLLFRLGYLAAAATQQQQQQQQQQQPQGGWLQLLAAVCSLYRPPQLEEMKAFAPFVLPVLTQCCVRLVLYSSMTKAASLWGSKAMAAHQLISGLYSVLGMPADTMAQVVNAAMPKAAAKSRRAALCMQRRIFKLAACTAAASAATQLAVVFFLTSRLTATDTELSRTVLLMGLRGSTVAAAYAATLPAPLLVMALSEAKTSAVHVSYLRSEAPGLVCCLWALPLLYNIIKLAVMGLHAPLHARSSSKRQPLAAKEAPM